jgi:hypothetical protein
VQNGQFMVSNRNRLDKVVMWQVSCASYTALAPNVTNGLRPDTLPCAVSKKSVGVHTHGEHSADVDVIP